MSAQERTAIEMALHDLTTWHGLLAANGATPTETIEEKTYRLAIAMMPLADREHFPTFKESLEDKHFGVMCRIIEIVGAEEREACAKIFDGFPDAEGLCGTVTSASAAKAIRARGAPPPRPAQK